MDSDDKKFEKKSAYIFITIWSILLIVNIIVFLYTGNLLSLIVIALSVLMLIFNIAHLVPMRGR